MRKLATCFLVAVMVCSAAGPKKKVSSDLKRIGKTSGVRVVVQWNTETGDETAAKISALGGKLVSEFKSIRSGVYMLPSTAVDQLEADDDVKFMSVDRPIRKKAAAVGITPATVNAQAAWNAGFNGKGIGVAILDSGINEEDDLGAYVHKPVYTEDFTVPAAPKVPSYGLDWYGHGQHIAGIIASNGKSSTCGDCTQVFTGIAPGVNLINLKVLDASGQGSDSFVMAAIDRAIALKDTYNIRVMNLSLGRPVYESYTQDPLCQAVEAAWKAGIAVVVSAGNDGRDTSYGNDGYSTINAPGNDPFVITVGAMRSMGTAGRADDLIASYSSKGPTAVDHIVKPDLVAPGNQIVSLLAVRGTLPLSNPQNLATLSTFKSNPPRLAPVATQDPYDVNSDKQPPNIKVAGGYSNQYYVLSGTSMASAVVSGAVADLLQAAPALTPDQVKMLLMQTASKSFPTVSMVTDATTGQTFTSYYDIFTVGAGYLDLNAALGAIQQVPTGLTAISPTATYDGATGNVDLAFDSSSVFSDKAMWGANTVASNKAMWGANTTWSNSVLVGNKAMWGAGSVWSSSNNMSANKALWGANAVWNNQSIWGASTTTNSLSTMVEGEQ